MRRKKFVVAQISGLLVAIVIISACVGQAQVDIPPESQMIEFSDNKTSSIEQTSKSSTSIVLKSPAPIQIIEVVPLDDVSLSNQVESTTSAPSVPVSDKAIDDIERLGFPLDGGVLNLIKEITIHEQAGPFTVAGTVRMIEGKRKYALVQLIVISPPMTNIETEDAYPFNIVKAVVLDEMTFVDTSKWASLNLDGLESIGFSPQTPPLILDKEIMIAEQSIEGQAVVSGKIQVLRGSNPYLLIMLTLENS